GVPLLVSSFFFLYELFLHLQRYQFIVFQEKMIQQIRHIRPSKKEFFFQKMQLFGLLAFPWALLFSEALSSILVICISVPVIFYLHNLSWRNLWQNYWPYFSIYSLIFISGFWSSD